jgi:hypothetical protein
MAILADGLTLSFNPTQSVFQFFRPDAQATVLLASQPDRKIKDFRTSELGASPTPIGICDGGINYLTDRARYCPTA